MFISLESPTQLPAKPAPETEITPISPEHNGWIPVGYNYDEVRNLQDEPFAKEDTEGFLLSNSFMTDFALTYRGYEAPLIFWIWGAIFAVSSMLKRQSYLKFGHKREYPNLYLMFVAPPGVAKKTTSIDFALGIMRDSVEHIQHPKTRVMRSPHIINDATEEALHKELKPQKSPVSYEEIRPGGEKSVVSEVVNTGSNAVITANEMTTIISKKKYQGGIVTKLTSLYDCRDVDERVTVSHGRERLENIFVNFFGATTPGAIKTQFPEDALSGGLISRMVSIFVDSSPRSFPLPVVFKGVPSEKELAKRLAWIADHAIGEYRFTPEAMEMYRTVYYPKIQHYKESGDEHTQMLYARMDTLLRKIPVILRAMEYTPGNEVGFEHLELAWKLIQYSISTSSSLLNKLGEGEDFKTKVRVMTRMKSKKIVTFRQLSTSLSRYVRAYDLKFLLLDLHEMGVFEAQDEDSVTKSRLSFAADETYYYLQGNPFEKYVDSNEADELNKSYDEKLNV
jgi:hypothetical protein